MINVKLFYVAAEALFSSTEETASAKRESLGRDEAGGERETCRADVKLEVNARHWANVKHQVNASHRG